MLSPCHVSRVHREDQNVPATPEDYPFVNPQFLSQDLDIGDYWISVVPLAGSPRLPRSHVVFSLKSAELIHQQGSEHVLRTYGSDLPAPR
jgi:hypothetical protein